MWWEINLNEQSIFGILTACRVSVSSRLLLRHLAAACLFLSLRTLLFSSSSGETWTEEKDEEKVRTQALWCTAIGYYAYYNTSIKGWMRDNYLICSAPPGAMTLGCRPHCWSGVGRAGAGAVGVSSVWGGHRGDQRLDHPLQVRARGNGRDGGDEGGTWCCQVSEILEWKGMEDLEFIWKTFRREGGGGGCKSAGWAWMKQRGSIKSWMV